MEDMLITSHVTKHIAVLYILYSLFMHSVLWKHKQNLFAYIFAEWLLVTEKKTILVNTVVKDCP